MTDRIRRGLRVGDHGEIDIRDDQPFRIFGQRRTVGTVDARMTAAVLEEFPKTSVSEIALRNGFVNFPHFSKLFRQRFDRTPSDYRRRRQSKRSYSRSDNAV
ncbi:helix-turn-helix domain-containing protein [Algihabitans albus]|uniref:helix-turn-helix domain-containing protein n=1 Tax=Algihabitans albus TaxID=2164067 RepID=UPI001ABCAB93|nr:helix-turn-helix domain-containing protein [Algihabitans albus]